MPLKVNFLSIIIIIPLALVGIAGYFIVVQYVLFNINGSNPHLEVNKEKLMIVNNFEDCQNIKSSSVLKFSGQVERCQTLEGEVFVKSNKKNNLSGNFDANFTTSRFSDTGDHYFISIPSDWKLTKENGQRGIQISYLEFISPDFKTHSSDCGPSDCVYYDKGMRFAISIENSNSTDSNTSEGIKPNPNKLIIQKKLITINGIETAYYEFQESSTSAGVLFDVQFSDNGNIYYIQAAYNPETYVDGEEMFKAIVDSFQLIRNSN